MARRDDIERVRDATDLVALISDHVALQPRGREHVGLCPFHDDRRPSFAVVTHKQSAFYKCHACGAAGDCFRFVQDHLGKDFGEAVRFLAERAGIELNDVPDEDGDRRRARRTWLRKALDHAQKRFIKVLADKTLGADARALIAHRRISPEMVEAFGIGCSADGWSDLLDACNADELPEKVLVAAGLLKERSDGGFYDAFRHRLMFPILDESGNPIAFGGRVLGEDEEPKYLNSCEHDLFHKSRTLYGLHLARREIARTQCALVAEGYTDVIACHQAGHANTVATLGTALTTDHARTLSRLCDVVVLLFDGDEAGRRAADRAIPIMAAHPVDLRICVLPDGLDPDTLLGQEGGHERFQEALDSATDAMEYLLARFEADLGHARGIAGTQRRLEAFVHSIARNGLDRAEPLRRAMLTARLGELAGVAPAVIDELLRHAPRPGATTHDDTMLTEHLPGLEDVPDDISPAIRRAEHEWLAVAIFAAGEVSLDAPGIKAPPLEDACALEIAGALAELHGSDAGTTVQGLLDRLTDEPARRLASDLYFEGRRLVEVDDGDAQAALARCRDTLEHCRLQSESRRRIEEFKSTSADDPHVAAAVIEKLREAGPRPGAMPRPAGH